MTLKRLLLIRAGETDWNFYGRWQGWAAVPLNDLGKQQARRLASFVRNIGLNALYSSDNQRAAETAQILAEQLDNAPIFDERLRERHIGHWQGMVLPEVRSWYPDEYARMLADLDGYRIGGGGESLNDVKARAEAAIKDIVAKGEAMPGNVTFGIVSHTTAMRAILAKLVPSHDLKTKNFGNTSVTTLTHGDDGEWKLTAINDQTHLEGLESRYMPEVEYDK